VRWILIKAGTESFLEASDSMLYVFSLIDFQTLTTALFLPVNEISATAQSLSNYIPFYEKPTYNCTIPRIIQGEWYSREKNLDTVTVIDAARYKSYQPLS
jgi:hypothetical protein